MALTGLPLIVLSFSATAIVVGATVWIWGRRWSLRLLLRALGVVVTEALLLISVGLVVNRHEGFFPSWDALFSSESADPPTYLTVAGSLDRQLAARAAGQGSQSQMLPWQPAGWAGWRLAAMPTLVIPAGYVQHPQWRYSVVLVVGSATSGLPATWQGAAALRVAASASRDVVAYVTTTSGTPVQTLTAELPDDLRRDLRVTEHRWAVVTSQADAALVRQAVLGAPWQYPAMAMVQNGRPSTGASTKPPAGPPAAARSKRAALRASSTGKLAVVQGPRLTDGGVADVSMPAGIASLTVRSSPAPSGLLTAITGAVGWAAAQTPPPLAASSPPVKSLPVPSHPRSGVTPHPSAATTEPSSTGKAANRKATRHGTGQPRH